MSEPDKYDDEVAAMLPLSIRCGPDETGDYYYLPTNVESMRPAVAARLRADGLEIERLQMEVASLKSPQPGPEQNYYFMLQGTKHEIAQLKAQLAEAQHHRDLWRAYAYGNIEFPPDDFTDGNLENRPQTAIDILKAQLAGLHGKIMNLPVPPQLVSSVNEYYLAGHCDARHAFAEIVAELCAVKGER